MGVCPLTKTPSISEIIIGLNDLECLFYSYTNFLALLAIEDTAFIYYFNIYKT